MNTSGVTIHQLESSNLNGVGIIPDTGQLVARFIGGREYAYDTTREEAEAIQSALLDESQRVLEGVDGASVGRMFNELVKKAGYDYTQIGG